MVFETIFSTAFSLISAIVFIALTIVMLERLIVLWVAMMISPLSALAIVLEPLGVPMGEMSFSSLVGKLFNYAVLIPA